MVGSIHMGWRHVLFANWPVEPSVVEPHLPAPLAVDTFDGRAWLSVVPFTNVDVRPRLFPSGTGFALPELNLRTYVTHDGVPGAYFFSLDADGILGVLGARLFHHLPYYYVSIDLVEQDDSVRFTSRRRHPGARPVRFDATYEPVGSRYRAGEGTLDRFLTDRDRYYTEAPDGSLRYARVRHDPWPLSDADATIHENTLFRANGLSPPESDPVYPYSPVVDTIASGSLRVRRAVPSSR